PLIREGYRPDDTVLDASGTRSSALARQLANLSGDFILGRLPDRRVTLSHTQRQLATMGLLSMQAPIVLRHGSSKTVGRGRHSSGGSANQRGGDGGDVGLVQD